MVVIKNILFTIILFGSQIVNGQRLKLISDADNSSIPYASVYLSISKVGTISDENGFFDMVDFPPNDTLIIQCMGYENVRILTNEIHAYSEIKMHPKTYSIAEVTVKPISALQIIKKAKDFIPINYPISTCIYNMTVENVITSNDSIYSCLRGSVISTSLGYMKDKPCEYRLVQADTYVNRKEDFAFKVPYHTDAYPANLIEQMHLTNLDFIKNTGDYQYSYAQTQGQGEYVINFSPKKVTKRHYLKGSMIINASDMAIKHIEYTTAMPNVVAYDEKVVELSVIVRVYSNGKHYIKSCKTMLNFEKIGGYYQLTHAENLFNYRYVRKDGNEFNYTATNSIVNHFGEVKNVDNYHQIVLYCYDLAEWNYNSVKTSKKQKFISNKISRIITDLKEKYPDMDFSELEKEE